MAQKSKRDLSLNFVRASVSHGRGRHAIEQLRRTATAGAIKGIVAAVYRTPNKSKFPTLAEIRRDTKQLLSFYSYKALPFLQELEWAVCQIEYWQKAIKAFHARKCELERAILGGRWSEARALVDEIEAQTGVSGWLIASKTTVLQWSESQIAQKDYARSVITQSTGLPVAIAHLCSQRNEGAVSVAGFAARAESTIENWGLSEDWATFVRWATMGLVPNTLDEANTLIRVGSTGSIVDLHETTATAMQAGSELLGQFSQREIDAFARLVKRAGVVGDARIARIAKSLGIETELSPCTVIAAFHEVTIAARSMAEDGLPGLFGPLVRSMASVTNRFENAKADLQEVRKIGLALDFVPIGRAIASYASSIAARGHFPYAKMAREMGRLTGTESERIWGVAVGDRELLLVQLEEATNSDSGLFEENCSQLELGDRFEIVTAAKARFERALNLNSWWDAIKIAVTCLIRFPGAAHEFALAEVLAIKSWSDLKQHASTLELGISLGYAIRDTSSEPERQKLHRHLQQAAIRILRSRGLPHFSDLARSAGDDDYLKCFLREACSESVMEVNTNIRSSRALAEERMRICQELSVIDEKHSAKHLQEIKQITFGLELEEGVRHFDSSRLFVNTEGLIKWAASALEEDFSRYLSLRSSALPDVAEIQAALITIQMGESGAAIPPILLEQPKTEADRLLTEIVRKLSREFYTSPVFGLNAFLSLRIRHGSLAGHLRGPLEELGVIASRREGGAYSPIERWAGIRSDLSMDLRQRFDDTFSNFSEKVDEKIRHIVDDRLQIRSEVKPSGAFDESVSLVLINALKGSLSDTATLVEIVDVCVNNFKISLEPTLERIRTEIGEKFKDEMDHLLQEVMVDLEVLLPESGLFAVLDALGRARTNLAFAVDRVAQWFRPLDKDASDRTYSIEQIVRMGEKLTTNARPTFQPVIHLEIEGEIPSFAAQSGGFLIADALFIAFDNVYLHAGLENPIDIHVGVSISKEGFIAFKISNEVSAEPSFDVRRAKLDRIRAQLQSGEFRKRVAGEGGTGLFKLRRLGEAAAFEGRSNVEFELTEDDFTVDLLVPLLVREVYEEAQHEAPSG